MSIQITLSPELQDRAIHIPGLKLMEPLSEGPMGVHYRARQEEDDDEVSVKLLHSFFSILPGDPFHIEQLMLTLRRVERLRHPAILPIQEFGSFSARPGRVADRVYVVTKSIEGGSLQGILAAQGESGIELIDELIDVIHDIASAISHAHQHGILHTSLKPANIFLYRNEHDRMETMISDFALAGVVRTELGVLEGEKRSSFLAPELPKGHYPDERSDVFSVGAILSLLIRTSGFSSEPRLEKLRGIANRCMLEDPSGRYQETSELLAALTFLKSAPEAPPTIAAVIPVLPEAPKEREPSRWPLMLVALSVAVLLCSVLLSRIWPASAPPAPPPIVQVVSQPEPEPEPEPEPVTVTAVLTTLPAEAEVWEGTEQLGVTPLSLTDLEDRFRTLEIRSSGFIPMVVEWRLGSGDREVTLTPMPKRRYSRYRRRRASSASTPPVEPEVTAEETIPAVDPVEAIPVEPEPEPLPAVIVNGKDQ